MSNRFGHVNPFRREIITKFTNVLVLLFTFSCFTLAGYMVSLQFESYMKNEDSTAISHEIFVGDIDDTYPTFSVCIYKNNGGIFRSGKGDKLCSYPCNTSEYRAANSKTCQKHCSSMEYYDILNGNKKDEHNLSSLNFEDKILSIESMTDEFYTQLKTGSKIRRIKFGFSKSNHTFTNSYQDSFHACVTKEGFLGNGNFLKRDYIELNIRSLSMFSNPEILVFVHQKGRFLTQVEQPHAVIENKALVDAKKKNKYGFSYEVNLRINTVEVLKKRPNAVIPCNELLRDEDNLWINKAIEIVGCVPPFFKRFVWNSTLNGNSLISDTCNMNQFNSFATEYSAKYNFGNISKLYIEPCYQTTNVVSLAQSLIPLKDDFSSFIGRASKMSVKIRIEYAMKGYKKATNNRAFGILNLWSQIGGFVGMFLGYSLLQLPSLVWKNIQHTINVMRKVNENGTKIL